MVKIKQKVLLVVDEENIRMLIRFNLEKAGYEVLEAADGKEALGMAQKSLPDIIILDLMLPGMDGLEVCRNLKQAPQTAALPIIMLTAKSSEYDTVVGLDSGADDYIPKPFRMMELISRIRALLRRTEDDGAEEYQTGNLYVCPSRHIATVDKKNVNLTLKEYEVLCLLLKNSGTVLSRTQLLNQVWGYEFDGESRTVDVHIRTPRQKLGSAGELVETVRGVGYKINMK